MTELFLLPLRCDDDNNKLFIEPDAFQCWKGVHLLYVTLGVLGAVSLFINLVFMNLFCFYPFQIKSSTLKLNASFDISFLIVKLIYELKIIFIKILEIISIFKNINKKKI